MDTKDIDIFKVLANETRLQILHWLKEPEVNFPCQDVDPRTVGVCVSSIQKKTGLAQSTVSHYLSMLEATGLIVSSRQGQSTYYRRNEEAFSQFAAHVATDL
ncbi:MAG: helix-turn-helix transcriptional regulator [Fischerella sp.]|jgi:ArsR family transcriptional regulator|uniref:ArsR/SmtB family transcription factor n=1 Tax=unclassified Fischerella TaxID=494603 RepID=UPI0004795441|nr:MULTISPECIES: metalloregulator ArsR/SmtB family transcription factor [unclassified Fischerella]NWF62484.1 helix-turn-helix transcriptional regulator [Fischerella sp.]